MNIIIRKADEKDIEDIKYLIKELADSIGEKSCISEDYIVNYMLNPLMNILIAEKNGEVVGLLSYSIRPNLYHASDCCMIEELVVRKNHQNEGVGKILISTLIEIAINLKCAEISVTTLINNERAIKFYKLQGLTEEGLLLEKHLLTDI